MVRLIPGLLGSAWLYPVAQFIQAQVRRQVTYLAAEVASGLVVDLLGALVSGSWADDGR
jgi:hypothetical protein